MNEDQREILNDVLFFFGMFFIIAWVIASLLYSKPVQNIYDTDGKIESRKTK